MVPIAEAKVISVGRNNKAPVTIGVTYAKRNSEDDTELAILGMVSTKRW